MSVPRAERDLHPREFAEIIDADGGERTVAAYIKQNPWLLYWTMCSTGGHTRYVVPEFPFGSRFKADLLLLNSYSGLWKAQFVELEPVGDRVFNRNRTPSQRLAGAIRQVDDWKSFVLGSSQVDLRRDMVRFARTKDALHYSIPSDDPSNGSGDRLLHPETVLQYSYLIVIGRSSRLDEEARREAGRYFLNHGVEILTYDRLLATAERRYPLSKHFSP